MVHAAHSAAKAELERPGFLRSHRQPGSVVPYGRPGSDHRVVNVQQTFSTRELGQHCCMGTDSAARRLSQGKQLSTRVDSQFPGEKLCLDTARKCGEIQ